MRTDLLCCRSNEKQVFLEILWTMIAVRRSYLHLSLVSQICSLRNCTPMSTIDTSCNMNENFQQWQWSHSKNLSFEIFIQHELDTWYTQTKSLGQFIRNRLETNNERHEKRKQWINHKIVLINLLSTFVLYSPWSMNIGNHSSLVKISTIRLMKTIPHSILKVVSSTFWVEKNFLRS